MTGGPVLKGLGLVCLCLAASATVGSHPHAQEPAPTAGAQTPIVAVAAQGGPSSDLSVPPADTLLMLVRTTLVALYQANFTGNYTVLRDLGTPELRAKNSSVQLGIAFTELRDQQLDLSPVLVLTPEFTEPPTLSPDGKLRLAGVFRAWPVQLSFVTVFKPVAGVWRIDGLSVRASEAQAPEVLKLGLYSKALASE